MFPKFRKHLTILLPRLPGLYIHIPFCRTKCPYCDFYSVTGVSKIPDFLVALEKEMEMAGQAWACFDTVYIGGGTPSILSPGQIERVLSAVRKNFPLAPAVEITLEANPADLSLSFLESLKTIGIHRLNLGVQSFDPNALEFLGRRHSVGQAVSALESARQAGFADLGLDLIYGIPGQTMNSWMSTLSRAASFSPEHISCYQLTLERGTPIGKASEEGKFSLPPEGEQLSFFMATSEALEKAGFIHYEVSNFARGTRFASRHNQKYWEHTPYLGLGPGAHSFCGRKRWWNDRSVDRYIAAIEAGEPPGERRRPYPGRPPHGGLFSGAPHQERDRRGSLLPGTWIRPDRGEGQDPEEPGSRGPLIPSGGPSQPHPKRPRASRQPGSHLKNTPAFPLTPLPTRSLIFRGTAVREDTSQKEIR